MRPFLESEMRVCLKKENYYALYLGGEKNPWLSFCPQVKVKR